MKNASYHSLTLGGPQWNYYRETDQALMKNACFKIISVKFEKLSFHLSLLSGAYSFLIFLLSLPWLRNGLFLGNSFIRCCMKNSLFIVQRFHPGQGSLQNVYLSMINFFLSYYKYNVFFYSYFTILLHIIFIYNNLNICFCVKNTESDFRITTTTTKHTPNHKVDKYNYHKKKTMTNKCLNYYKLR